MRDSEAAPVAATAASSADRMDIGLAHARRQTQRALVHQGAVRTASIATKLVIGRVIAPSRERRTSDPMEVVVVTEMKEKEWEGS